MQGPLQIPSGYWDQSPPSGAELRRADVHRPEGLAEYGVVRLLGHLGLASGVERRQVPLEHLHQAVARRRAVRDAVERAETVDSQMMLWNEQKQWTVR